MCKYRLRLLRCPDEPKTPTHEHVVQRGALIELGRGEIGDAKEVRLLDKTATIRQKKKVISFVKDFVGKVMPQHEVGVEFGATNMFCNMKRLSLNP